MTIGIYRLCFNGTDQCYIGQSINIGQRYKAHIRALKSGSVPEKLSNAYNLYGIPELEILCECSVAELDILEQEAIAIFDSFNNGFNSLESVISGLKGQNHGNSRYTNDKILQVATLLTDPTNRAEKISKITGVTVSAIRSIACLQNHAWIYDVAPDIANKLIELNGVRNTAISTGKKYPAVMSPDGVIYKNIPSFKNFCIEHGLCKSHFTNLLKGKLKSHKGWRVAVDG
jgi:hypothetical protein